MDGVSIGTSYPLSHSLRTDPPRVDVSDRIRLERLKTANGAVKGHEQAHLSAIGPYAQGPVQYTYMIGPDGSRYAVAGSIDVDLRPVPGDPAATLRKARALIRSAYAPSNPSSADMHVAAAAYRMEMEARRELARAKEAGNENATAAAIDADTAGAVRAPSLREAVPVPGDPDATLQKARTLLRRALAVSDGSFFQSEVAVRAYRMASAARRELALEHQLDQRGGRLNLTA